jgi:hypothetical protein
LYRLSGQLSYLGLSGDGSDLADLLAAQGVDDGALAHVGVTHHPHADLLLVLQHQHKEKEMDQAFLNRVE